MEMGHSQWHHARWAAMWPSKTFSSCQSLFHTISITVSLLPSPAAAHMAHWSGINMVPLSLDPKCLFGKMCFLTELSHNSSLSQEPVCVGLFVIEYLPYAEDRRCLDSTIPTESVHIPNWENKERGKKRAYPLMCCVWISVTNHWLCKDEGKKRKKLAQKDEAIQSESFDDDWCLVVTHLFT